MKFSHFSSIFVVSFNKVSILMFSMEKDKISTNTHTTYFNYSYFLLLKTKANLNKLLKQLAKMLVKFKNFVFAFILN